MAHTYSVNLIHCIFSTKNRLPLILEPEKIWQSLRNVAQQSRINVLAIGGTANHVHLLLSVPKTRAIADVVRELKANSSRQVRGFCRVFHWQDGYGSISVSPSAIQAVTRYIQHQAEHHRRQSFEDEYVSILRRAGICYDPKEVFD